MPAWCSFDFMSCSIYVHFSLVKIKFPLISLMDFSKEYLVLELFKHFLYMILHRKNMLICCSTDLTISGVCEAMGEGDNKRRRGFFSSKEWFDIICDFRMATCMNFFFFFAFQNHTCIIRRIPGQESKRRYICRPMPVRHWI